MKRHSDRQAFLKESQPKNLNWSGRVGDRDVKLAAAAAAQEQQRCADSKLASQHSDLTANDFRSTRLLSEAPSPLSAAGSQEQRPVRTLVSSSSNPHLEQRAGRIVAEGEHHEGRMGVYMAHKISKLRSQTDGAVPRLEGPDGVVFKGVLAHINGYTTVPVARLRELLASRGGVVEAYNTPRVTHMICEALPYAKIRELRKLLHPPTVVRPSWVEDSARAGRKLPLAGYMVDGVFVQKRTLADSFATAATSTPKSPFASPTGSKERDQHKSKRSLEKATESSSESRQQGRRAGSGEKSVSGILTETRRGSGGGGGGMGDGIGGSGGSVGDEKKFAAMPSPSKAQSSPFATTAAVSSPPSNKKQRAIPIPPSRPKETATSPYRTLTSADIDLPPNSGGSSRGEANHGGAGGATGKQERRSIDNKQKQESPGKDPKSDAGVREKQKATSARGKPVSDSSFFYPFELPDMITAGEGGRTTNDDPTFMRTFFQNSRLHFIGVGRARAVKLVNAGLAARARPGGSQPIYGGELGKGESRVVLHVDMDCFFVSVLTKDKPELKDKAVAVAHSASNAKGAGSSEVSSCNYPARAKGVRAGMFMMQAKRLCPELAVLKYDFEAYSKASDKMYGVFLRHAPVIMAQSCDEAFLELGKDTDPMVACTEIRRCIFEQTGCSASAGASTNMLLARIATKMAKPNGQFWLPPQVAMRHMGPLPVQDLPGVGWKLGRRLNEEGIKKCSDLWPLSVSHLQKGLRLGDKTGQALWDAARGRDDRPVKAPPDRKSIGAEVNYGVRFDSQERADWFLSQLAIELSRRMDTEGVVGRALTLKIMKQKDGAETPRKFLGHGICDAHSKLRNLHRATADASTIKPVAVQLLKEANIPPDRIRGIGVQMTRLEATGGVDGIEAPENPSGGGALREWLVKPREDKKSNKSDSFSSVAAAGAPLGPSRSGAPEHPIGFSSTTSAGAAGLGEVGTVAAGGAVSLAEQLGLRRPGQHNSRASGAQSETKMALRVRSNRAVVEENNDVAPQLSLPLPSRGEKAETSARVDGLKRDANKMEQDFAPHTSVDQRGRKRGLGGDTRDAVKQAGLQSGQTVRGIDAGRDSHHSRHRDELRAKKRKHRDGDNQDHHSSEAPRRSSDRGIGGRKESPGDVSIGQVSPTQRGVGHDSAPTARSQAAAATDEAGGENTGDSRVSTDAVRDKRSSKREDPAVLSQLKSAQTVPTTGASSLGAAAIASIREEPSARETNATPFSLMVPGFPPGGDHGGGGDGSHTAAAVAGPTAHYATVSAGPSFSRPQEDAEPSKAHVPSQPLSPSISQSQANTASLPLRDFPHGGGEVPSSPSVTMWERSRQPARSPAASPSPMSPSTATPAHRAAQEMPSSGRSARSPSSMSQITFSQIDGTVLNALPQDIREDVMAQLAARQEQQDQNRHKPSSSSSLSLPGAALPGPTTNTDGVPFVAQPPNNRRAGTTEAAAVDLAVGKGVREGFDLNIREQSNKPQQVSLDSLWTLRKMRGDYDDGDHGKGNENTRGNNSAVFDQDSLRAMPLGLGLQIASLSENQRAQIVRQYAQTAAIVGAPVDTTSPGTSARSSSSPNQHAAGFNAHSPTIELLSPPAAFEEGAESEGDGGAGAGATTAAAREVVTPAHWSVLSPQSSELHRISLSQVDRDVLDCLPSEVREEVLRALAATASGSKGGDVNHARIGADEPGDMGAGAVPSSRLEGTTGDVADRFEHTFAMERSGKEHEGSGGAGALRSTEVTPSNRVDSGGGFIQPTDFVDLRSPPTPSPPTPSSQSQGRHGRKAEGVFEVEPARTLRRTLSSWIGGAVRSPSQWHLELLFRYLQELIEGDRLDETATLLRCLGRLSRKANDFVDVVESVQTVGGHASGVKGNGRGLSIDESRFGVTDGGRRADSAVVHGGGGEGRDASHDNRKGVRSGIGGVCGDRGGSWLKGYHAIVDAVQELVRKRTGGATLAF